MTVNVFASKAVTPSSHTLASRIVCVLLKVTVIQCRIWAFAKLNQVRDELVACTAVSINWV